MHHRTTLFPHHNKLFFAVFASGRADCILNHCKGYSQKDGDNPRVLNPRKSISFREGAMMRRSDALRWLGHTNKRASDTGCSFADCRISCSLRSLLPLRRSYRGSPIGHPRSATVTTQVPAIITSSAITKLAEGSSAKISSDRATPMNGATA